MRLYLIRHAAALPVGGTITTDDERPLSQEGTKTVQLVAAGLKAMGCSPAIILSSPLKRAVETAQILMEVLRPPEGLQTSYDLAPGAAAADVSGLFAGVEADEAAIVGHEPDFGSMTAEFLGADGEIEFKKGAVCCLEFEGSPSPPATLVWLMPPSAFKALA